MRRAKLDGRTTCGVVLLGVALTVGVVSACSSDRTTFGDNGGTFTSDAAVEDVTQDCPFQCSLDGRSVLRSCTGEVVQTCADTEACGAGLCQAPCAAAAADQSSNGCEFFFQAPRFSTAYPQSCHATFLVNTSSQPAEIALELDGAPLDITKSLFRTEPGSAALVAHTGPIAPGESVILFVSDRDPNTGHSDQENFGYMKCPDGVVPAKVYDIPTYGTAVGSAYRISSNVPVAVTSIYPFGGSKTYIPSATLLLPVATWTTQHIVVNGWEVASTGQPAAQIVASEDDTEVTLLPTTDIQNGRGVQGGAAKVPATYRLDRGQFLELVQDEELSGTIVSSTKPTTVFGGHACANIPAKVGACDTLLQQIPGFEHWGSEYVGVGYRPRLGNEHEMMRYRIVAARDGTQLDYDPAIPAGAPTTMAAGEVVTFTSGVGDAFVVRTQDAEHAIYLAGYMSGSDGDAFTNASFGGRGDPEFVNVVPTGQYLNTYSFYADPTYAETSLVVVRKKTNGKLEDVWLECAGNLTGFQPVGTRGEYEWMRVDLARNRGPGDSFDGGVCQTGLQRMKSVGAFSATLWGWDIYSSYAYTGGIAQRKLVQQPLPPIR